MVLEPIYLDLSSSDDDDDDHARAGPTALMYLSKVFHMDADDDDVRIIDKPTSTSNVKRDRARVIRSALDDDECCILDTDPGADATLDIVTSLDTDELVMTGEKGPVACRDFPHARYLCVHFPFKTTLHSNFCAQCHCYVCDSLAPCLSWGEGSNPNDHCHASEEPRWKTLRKVAKCGSVPSLATAAADVNGSGIPTGGSRLVQSNLSQHAKITPPATQSLVGTPVGSGGSRKLQATIKRDPLVIKLKSKGRGKPSEPPHLGVRSSRPHRILPLSSFPGHRNPRSTSTPGILEEFVSLLPRPALSPQPINPYPRIGRPSHPSSNPLPPRPTLTIAERLDKLESIILTATLSPQPIDSTPGLERPGGEVTVADILPHPRSIPSLNSLPGRAGLVDILAEITRPPVVQHPQPIHNPHDPHNPTVSPSVPETPPSLTAPPPPVIIDVTVLRPPSADATVQDFVSPAPPISDSRYVPVSSLRDQDVNMDLSTSSQPQAVDSLIVGADYVPQRFINSPVNSAETGSSSHTIDTLAGPIEGWEVDPAVEFNAFAAGIRDEGPSPEQISDVACMWTKNWAQYHPSPDDMKRFSDACLCLANFVNVIDK